MNIPPPRLSKLDDRVLTPLMKKGLFILLLGALLGILGWRYYQRLNHPTLGERLDGVADRAHDAAAGATQAVADKAEAAKQAPDKIKTELDQTERAVRSKARVVGDSLDDARIVAVIKGKYLVDSNLSALAISVECTDGEVKLTGSVTAPEHLNRAVLLAQQTHGVRNVVSLLVVKN